MSSRPADPPLPPSPAEPLSTALETEKAGEADARAPDAVSTEVSDARSRSAKSGATTARLHREERRADKLAEIGAQIAAGTLVVRQMTGAEHDAASEAAQQARARHVERSKLYRQSR
jgi:hypothetical protein